MAKKSKSKKDVVSKEPVDAAASEETTIVRPASSILRPSYSFNILEQNVSLLTRAQAILASQRNAKRPTSLKSMAEVRQSMIPLQHFALQYATGMYGLPQSCLVEIIGAEGIGKTSLSFQFAGWAMSLGCPILYIECEGKPMPMMRAMRMMSTDINKAVSMVTRVQWEKAKALLELDHIIHDWVRTMRGKIQGPGEGKKKDSINVPMDTPLVVIADPFSKLMSNEEAAGYYAYDDFMDKENKKKFKETGDGTNFGHAKFAHRWSRRLPEFLTAHNVLLIMVHHQNAKIDMNAGPMASFMSAETSELYNKTHIGGKALNQNAALQLILARRGLAKGTDGSPRGVKVRMRVDKNSYGPSGRVIEYELRNENSAFDTPEYLDPGLHFDEDMAKLFADNRYLNTQVDSKTYSCAALGLTGVTGDEFGAAFHANRAVMEMLGRQLAIEGYIEVADLLKGSTSDAPAAAAPAAQ